MYKKTEERKVYTDQCWVNAAQLNSVGKFGSEIKEGLSTKKGVLQLNVPAAYCDGLED